jgi:molybdate transport system regulatory protein
MAAMPKKPPLKFAGALGHGPADKRLEILRRVARAGSISQAAREAGVSYKAAWQALDTLSNLAGVPLVERAVGGSGGGGARLTPAGQELLRAAGEVASARKQVLSRLADQHPGAGAMAGLALRTSMRNQLPGVVEKLQPHAGAVRVWVRLPGELLLAARITRESAQLLGLVPGLPVLVLCKATAVTLASQDASAMDAGNRVPGTITRISRAAAGGEFALALAGGQSLVGFAPGGHGLKLGALAVASVAEAALVIALAA